MGDCSTFDCSSYHMNLDPLPLSISCQGEECTPELCCTVTPQTCEGFDCSNHINELSRQPATISCSGTVCTEGECCNVVPQTCKDFDCSKHENDLSLTAEVLKCSGGNCTEKECCTVTPGLSIPTNNRSRSQLIEDVSSLKQVIKNLKKDVEILNDEHKPLLSFIFDYEEGEKLIEEFQNNNNSLFFIIGVTILIYFLLTYKK